MIKDYSNIPSIKLIANNTGKKVKFDLRDDWKQIPVEIEDGQSLKITLETSDAMAVLDNKVKGLELAMLDDETPEEEPEVVSVVNNGGNTYRFTLRDVPTKTMTEVAMGDGESIKGYAIYDCEKWSTDEKVNKLTVGIGEGDIGFGYAEHIYDELSDTAYNLIHIYITTEEIEQSAGMLQFSEENPTSGWYVCDTRTMIFTSTDVPQPVEMRVLNISSCIPQGSSVSVSEFNVADMDYLFEKVELIHKVS